MIFESLVLWKLFTPTLPHEFEKLKFVISFFIAERGLKKTYGSLGVLLRRLANFEN